MPKELKGTRYLTNPEFGMLIQKKLPFMDFMETLEFYEWAETWMTDNDRALLDCNDRFYLLTVTCKRKDAWHEWLFDRCREVEVNPDSRLDLWARYHYKAEWLETPTLTPDGWRKHGDLRPGDFVFGPDGEPTRVVATTPVFTDADCYRVTFDKGEQIVVSGDHLWTVDVQRRSRLPNGKRADRANVTINTRSLAKNVEHAKVTDSVVFPSVTVTRPLLFSVSGDLPLHPYVLGAWLGDGSRGEGVIANDWRDDEITKKIEACGYRTRRRGPVAVGIYGIRPALRNAGVMNNKHIPEQYLRALTPSRWELLRGLMDTDGHCDVRGTATFVNTNERLARDVFDLAAGLGLKPSLRQHIGKYADEPYPFWHVSFQAVDGEEPVFHLLRKQERASIAKRTRSKRHAIINVERVASVPVNCIQVEREDGLYLTGRHLITTHNSSIGTFAGIIQEIMIDPEITVAIMSGTNKVAQPFLKQIMEEFESNENLKRIHHDVLWAEPRKQAPQWSIAGGIIVKRQGNPKECTIEAFGLIDGMRTGKHYRLLDYDDLIDESMVDNPDIVKKVTIRWELSDNLGQLEGTRKWHWGTRYSYADTYGIILDRAVLKERRYPATDNGQLNGKPVLLKPERWNEVKSAQRSTVNAQMLLNPLAGNESTFSMLSLQHYDVIPAVMNVYIMVDPSKGKSKRSDRTAIAVIGIDVGGNKYLLDGYCHRMKLSRRYDLICQLRDKWTNHPGVQIVRVGYEQYGMQVDLEVIKEYQERDDDEFEIEELATTRDGTHSKTDRIQRLEPDFNRGLFYLPAMVYHPDYGGGHANQALWDIWTEEDSKRMIDAGAVEGNIPVGNIVYRPMQGMTNRQRACAATLQTYRIVTALKRLNEDNDMYDLTRTFVEEYRLHPFAPHDDLLDGASRIFDMEPTKPVPFESVRGEPRIHMDS